MPSGFEVRFEFFGEEQVVRRLDGFRERAINLTEEPEVIEGLREVFFGFEREQFESQGGHGSGGWDALKPATIRAKAGKDLDPRILHATHRLLKALTEQNEDFKEEVTKDSILLAADVYYGPFHMTGTDRMPQRKPVDTTEGDRRKLIRVIQAALVPSRRASIRDLMTQ